MKKSKRKAVSTQAWLYGRATYKAGFWAGWNYAKGVVGPRPEDSEAQRWVIAEYGSYGAAYDEIKSTYDKLLKMLDVPVLDVELVDTSKA